MLMILKGDDNTLLLLALFAGIVYALYVAIRYAVRAIYSYPKLKEEIVKLTNDKKEQALRLWNEKNKEIEKRERIISSQRLELTWRERQVRRLDSALDSRNPFTIVAEMAADVRADIYRREEDTMRNKARPAYSSAEIVSQLRKKTRGYVSEYKCMQYKYEFLLSTFPELKRYVDDEEALLSLSESECYDDFKSNRDCCMDYLTDEEYKSLSVTERNQLALDRYKRKPKSNWTIGMLYEMYIGYLLRENKGYSVVQFGVINGLNDLGRDIIAKKVFMGIETTYIIQCKNWASTKEIHENVVCQIFGTAMEYNITHECSKEHEVIPVLYVTTKLSETANLFAKRLGVEVYVEPMGDFPMIKCNINGGQRIYHLPFDQQYWRTKIERNGEFYAWTVKEAEGKGFRRAMKHL